MILYHATSVENARCILREGFRAGSFTDDVNYAATYLRPMGAILVVDIPESLVRSRGEEYGEWVLRRGVKLPLPSRMFRVVFSGHFLEWLGRRDEVTISSDDELRELLKDVLTDVGVELK